MLNEKTSSDETIITATRDNYDQLANFINQPNRIHRHLDWFGPLDWLGNQPFLIELQDQKIQAALCATPENQAAAWIRTFAIKKHLPLQPAWHRLLSRAIQKLRDQGIDRLAALALHGWFETLLIDSGFSNLQNIVVLEWQGNLPKEQSFHPGIVIRPMQLSDLPEVETIDQLAFPPLWQNSLAGLTKALNQPGISTVALKGQRIIGYQISTSMTIYGHLARLAVHPDFQRQGIAFSLVYDLLEEFKRRGFWRITVNTQSNNTPSLKLYKKFGFKRTPEEIPVFEINL